MSNPLTNVTICSRMPTIYVWDEKRRWQQIAITTMMKQQETKLEKLKQKFHHVMWSRAQYNNSITETKWNEGRTACWTETIADCIQKTRPYTHIPYFAGSPSWACWVFQIPDSTSIIRPFLECPSSWVYMLQAKEIAGTLREVHSSPRLRKAGVQLHSLEAPQAV